MKYIASFSGGKDSIATIILAHEHNEPLDLIIFAEVMFDEHISGELPEHIDFVKNKCIPLFESWGYETEIIHGKKTFLDEFYHVVTKTKKPERMNKRVGFPMAGKCYVNRDCKVRPIQKYLKQFETEEITQYIGIAADEVGRIERLNKPREISLLEKYGITQEVTFSMCKERGLLSPTYNFSNRGGCWFCPWAGKKELKSLRENHRDLWDWLIKLENEPDVINTNWNNLLKRKITENEELFFWEDAQVSIFDFPECIPDSMKNQERRND